MAVRFLNYLVLVLLLLLIHGFISEAEAGNIMVKCKNRERQALIALKQDFIDDYGFLSSWGQKECCQWEGIRCSNRTGHVVRLDLHADLVASLRGTINPSLAELRHLNYLDLSYNDHLDINHIPQFIGSLTHLKYLDLRGLFCGGKIPYELGNLSRLQYLDLRYNFLTGGIPNQLWHLTSLVYLDLGFNDLHERIPHQLGNLSSLQHLGLGSNYLTGTIPHDLGNLTHLQYLDFGSIPSGNGVYNLTSDLEWLSHLSSLKILRLAHIDLSSANDWPKQVSNHFQLEELSLSDCNFPPITSSFSSITSNISSNSLTSIDLSLNKYTFSIIPWLLSYTYSLAKLDLSGNYLSGPIPEDFANFSSLEEVNLADNLLEGEIPRYLGELCSLQTLNLTGNNLTGLQGFVSSSTGPRCGFKSIQFVDLSSNQITGSFPNVSLFSSLRWLDLSYNHLNGTISQSVGQLSNLRDLRVSYNSLQGEISQVHFSKLSKLQVLDLSHNNALVFNITHNWVPPFNLYMLILASCKLGPSFPRWLQTQRELWRLDISNAEISEMVPSWFWNLPPWLDFLDLSHNHFRGEIENLSLISNSTYPEMDLSYNMFEGSVPAFLSFATILDLSNNKFIDASFLLCAESAKELRILDISNNQLSGELPKCEMHLESLVLLDLTNNNLQGTIPDSVGLSIHILSLHLGTNKFSGVLPLSLCNCTNLRILDAVENSLSGPIPSWIGDKLKKLVVLSLRSNRFSGILPSSICHLAQLQLLDLSLNNISGTMPTCLGNLTALANQYASYPSITHNFDEKINERMPHTEGFYIDSASIIWKGHEAKYQNTLGLVRSIDLSSNKLFGEIPSDVMNLIGLISFNISRNNLCGEIPTSIGQLKSLDFLDLSRNHLFGQIPLQLSQIDRLSVLDLSYNNLSGEIPLGTQLQSFNASAYAGNPKLCGAPLLKKCPEKQRNNDRNDDEDGESYITQGFYISMAIGFVLGFWGICGSLIFKKSWRYAYFKFLNNIYDKLYLVKAISMAKLKRRFTSST